MSTPGGPSTGSPPCDDRRHPAGLPRAVVLLLGSASAVVVAAGLYAASWLVGPVFLALVIVITIHPVHDRLRRLGLPSWTATVLLILIVYGLLVLLAGVVVVSVARLATILPSYAGEANALVASGVSALDHYGVGPAQLNAVRASLNAGKLVGLVGGFLLGLAGLVGNLVFLLSLLLFLGIEAAGVSARLAFLARDRATLAQALTDFARATRRYMAVNTIFGLLTGFVDTVALAWLGVPLAVLWGLLVFITNYVPYLGFWIGLAPPVLLALLVGGWESAIAVVGVFVVVNFVLTSVVQPKFVGDAVGLSVTVILVALVFWGWLLGPIGAVLATPLTLLLKMLLVDVDPRAHCAVALIGSAGRVHQVPVAASPTALDGSVSPPAVDGAPRTDP
jgi:AI-2 transport protein TqsA